MAMAMMVVMMMMMMMESKKGGWLGRMVAGRHPAFVVPHGPGNGNA